MRQTDKAILDIMLKKPTPPGDEAALGGSAGI
jgi:hypothetical protein